MTDETEIRATEVHETEIRETEIDTVTGRTAAGDDIGRGLRRGAAAGARAARDTVRGLGRVASGTVYGGAYSLAYGVTFAGMLVGHFIPRDSAMGRGLREGADRAIAAVHDWETPKALPEGTPGVESGDGRDEIMARAF